MSNNIRKIYRIMLIYKGKITQVEPCQSDPGRYYVTLQYRREVRGRKLGLSTVRLKI